MEHPKGLKAWLAEYYPAPADAPEAVCSEKAAVEHGLRKWQGAKPQILADYEISAQSAILFDEYNCTFVFGCGTCALCHRNFLSWRRCGDCILVKVRGIPCDDFNRHGKMGPYQAFCSMRDPEPMIQLLEDALDALGAEDEGETSLPLPWTQNGAKD